MKEAEQYEYKVNEMYHPTKNGQSEESDDQGAMDEFDEQEPENMRPGFYSKSSEFPYVVSYHYRKSGKNFCTGVLLTPIFTLTALNCFLISPVFYRALPANYKQYLDKELVRKQAKAKPCLDPNEKPRKKRCINPNSTSKLDRKKRFIGKEADPYMDYKKPYYPLRYRYNLKQLMERNIFASPVPTVYLDQRLGLLPGKSKPRYKAKHPWRERKQGINNELLMLSKLDLVNSIRSDSNEGKDPYRVYGPRTLRALTNPSYLSPLSVEVRAGSSILH